MYTVYRLKNIFYKKNIYTNNLKNINPPSSLFTKFIKKKLFHSSLLNLKKKKKKKKRIREKNWLKKENFIWKTPIK